MARFGRRPAKVRPSSKACKHYEEVADVAQRVASRELPPPSGEAARLMCEEYLLLHLEFKALRTHLEREDR